MNYKLENLLQYLEKSGFNYEAEFLNNIIKTCAPPDARDPFSRPDWEGLAEEASKPVHMGSKKIPCPSFYGTKLVYWQSIMFDLNPKGEVGSIKSIDIVSDGKGVLDLALDTYEQGVGIMKVSATGNLRVHKSYKSRSRHQIQLDMRNRVVSVGGIGSGTVTVENLTDEKIRIPMYSACFPKSNCDPAWSPYVVAKGASRQDVHRHRGCRICKRKLGLCVFRERSWSSPL